MYVFSLYNANIWDITCEGVYMGKFLTRLIQSMLVGYFVLTVVGGISLPANLIYLIVTFILLSTTVFLSSVLLNFLTIRENFVTSFLMCTILCIGVFFLMDGFMPGFELEVYTFEGLDTGNLVINPFEVTKVFTIVYASVVYSFITSVLNVLEKSA